MAASLPPTPDELREHVAGVEGLLCLLTDPVDEALLDAAPELRAISNYAVGTDNVDLAAAAAAASPSATRPTCSPTRPPTSRSRCCSRSRGGCPRASATCARASG